MKQSIFLLFLVLNFIQISNTKSLSRLNNKKNENIKVSLKFKKVPLSLLIGGILKGTGLNYLISPKIKGIGSVEIDKVPWDEALNDVVDINNCAWLRVENTIIVCTKKELEYFTYDFLKRMEYLSNESLTKVTLKFTKTPINLVLSSFAKFGAKSLILSPKIKGSVSVNINNMSWKLALELIIRLQGLNLLESGSKFLVLTQKEMHRVFHDRLIRNNGLK
ncbi:MAG: hypothetical protein COB02_17875 [Candidatus Cloacimonadota bacterium]|nr:MAG: hypothetical protein COB02_17875 [Candidatus Cloacimonadota bacterium]